MFLLKNRAIFMALLAATGWLLSCSADVRADLNLIEVHPDITASRVAVIYSASTSLSAKSSAVTYLNNDPGYSLTNGKFDIELLFDAQMHATGTLSITGQYTGFENLPGTPGHSISINTNPANPLLTGTLSDFAYHASDMQFLFQPTGGELSPYWGSTVGVILTGVSPGGLVSSFSRTGATDTFPVPEPSSWLLAVAGLASFVALVAIRRRRMVGHSASMPA